MLWFQGLFKMQQSLSFLIALTILELIHVGTARDLRNVTEPKIPQTCTYLKPSGGDDTQTIRKALDSCAMGQAVALSSGTFYSGPLTIPSGVSLLVQQGVTLKALTDPELYDLGAKTCGTVDQYGVGCKAFITMLGAKSSGIYGKGTIDGQANVTMTGKNLTWYQLSNEAWTPGRYQNNPQLLQINKSEDITLHQITLTNSPFYTVACYESNGLTAWNVTVTAPTTARNTDGFDPIGCQNVTIAHSYISVGDDHIAIKALTAPSRHISVLNNHLNEGRGMSIGSEVNHGASDVTVSGLTINSHINGIHIKSNMFRGGHVKNILFDNICIQNAHTPIHIDMMYDHLHGNRTPKFRNITFSNMWALARGQYSIHGLSNSNQVQVTFTNVHVTKGSTYSETFANITGNLIEDATGRQCGYSGNE